MYIIKEKNLKDFWFLFVFISFFEPNYFVYIPILHIVCQAITIFAFIYSTIICMYNHLRLNKITLYTIIYGIVILITSVIHKNLELSTVRIVISIIGLALYFYIYGFERVRKPLLLSFFCLTTLNLGLNFFKRSSIEVFAGDSGWFLTGSNALIIYILPAVCLAIVSIEKGKQKFLSIITIIVSLYTAVASDTATTVFILFTLISIWLLQRAINMSLIKIRGVVALIIFSFVLVVILQVQNNIYILRFIVEDILKRDMSFTSRTFIWKESLHQILQSPFIGHGSSYSFHVMVSHVGFWADHAHNHYLQQLIQGGIIQMVLFILIIIEMVKRMRRLPSKIVAWGTVSVLSTGVMLLFESYTNAMIYSVVYLIYSFCDEYLQTVNAP